jgi:hypothetical protein
MADAASDATRLIQRNVGSGRTCDKRRMEAEAEDEVRQCVEAMIARHGRRAAEVAQRFADLHFILDERETGEFWSALACLLRRRLHLLT